MNISLSERQAEMIGAEVAAGRYTSASEFMRELVREWEDQQIAKDMAELERCHAGAFERDTTPEEEAAILQIQKEVRAEMRAKNPGRKGRKA